MEKYASYKDSGIAWVGKIPSHWQRWRLKFTGKFCNGLTYSPADVKEEGVCVLRSSNIQNGILCFEDDVYVESSPQKLNVNVGDIIICSRNGSANLVGKCAIITEPINATFGAFMMRYRPSVCAKFAYYLFNTTYRQYRGLFATTTINQLTQTVVSMMDVPLPPLSEQESIADWLDVKCGKIDDEIAKQRHRIELLEELKQAIVTQAVTHGIDSDVKFKPSGISWLGDIPEHWNIKRMRFLVKITTGNKDTVNREDDGAYPFYVRSPKIERINSYAFDGEAVLMAGDGVGAGKVIHYANGKFDFHQRVYCFYDFKEIEAYWLFLYLKSNFIYKIEEGGAKNTVDSVRQPWLKDFPIAFPEIIEQQEIIAHVKKRVSKIDARIAKVPGKD